MSVAIEFMPTIKGPVNEVLTITSSDPKHLTTKVRVSGTGK